MNKIAPIIGFFLGTGIVFMSGGDFNSGLITFITLTLGYLVGLFVRKPCDFLGHRVDKKFYDLSGYKRCYRCRAKQIGDKWES